MEDKILEMLCKRSRFMLYIICNPTAGNGRAKKICQDALAYLQNRNIEF